MKKLNIVYNYGIPEKFKWIKNKVISCPHLKKNYWADCKSVSLTKKEGWFY